MMLLNRPVKQLDESTTLGQWQYVLPIEGYQRRDLGADAALIPRASVRLLDAVVRNRLAPFVPSYSS